MCLNEITNKIKPISRGYKVFCNETEQKVTPPFYGKTILKRVWVDTQSKLSKLIRYRETIPLGIKKYHILGMKINFINFSASYESGFHVFHNKEDAEKCMLDLKNFKIENILVKYFYNLLRSHDLVIKEVLIVDPICVGYQRYENFSGLVTVARRIYVL